MTEEGADKDLVNAIQDLTRVTIALSGGFGSRADAVRRLHEIGMPPVRIATLLSVGTNQVHAELSKAKSRTKKKEVR